MVISGRFCFLFTFVCIRNTCTSGADPGFQVRGGTLKKIAPSGGRREKCWGISCEKSRFYAKKSYFFQFGNLTIWYVYSVLTLINQPLLTRCNCRKDFGMHVKPAFGAIIR